ncbi:SHOCT domain-containing protein, partial [Acinetobacter baumannii]
MIDADELNKLADLHARGVLSDEEFAQAKARILSGS